MYELHPKYSTLICRITQSCRATLLTFFFRSNAAAGDRAAISARRKVRGSCQVWAHKHNEGPLTSDIAKRWGNFLSFYFVLDCLWLFLILLSCLCTRVFEREMKLPWVAQDTMKRKGERTFSVISANTTAKIAASHHRTSQPASSRTETLVSPCTSTGGEIFCRLAQHKKFSLSIGWEDRCQSCFQQTS